MNEITKYKLVIEFDSWQPFSKSLEDEMDRLLGELRGKQLLAHAGNVRTTITTEIGSKQ